MAFLRTLTFPTLPGIMLWLIFCVASSESLAQADYKRFFDEDNLPPLRELFESGRYDIVEQACGYALERGQPSPEWRTLLMWSLSRQGKYEEAIAVADEIPAKFKDALSQLMEVHDFYQQVGKKEKAATVLEVVNAAALKQKPKDRKPLDLVALGKAGLALGADPQTVLEQYFDQAKKDRAKEKRKPNEAHPGLVEAHIAAGDLALAKADYQRAATEFEAAIKFQPNNPDLRFGLAEAFFPGDRKKAIGHLEKAIELNPMHANSLLLMSEYLVDSEQYEKAQELLARVLSVNQLEPLAWAYVAAIENLARNDLKASAAARTQALSVWDQDPLIDHTIGRVLSRNYRFEEGAAAQKKALEMDETYLDAKLQLANDFMRLGDEKRAFELAAEIVEADPYNVLAYNLSVLQEQIEAMETIETDHFTIRMPANEAVIYGDRAAELLEESKAVLCEKYGLELKDRVLVEFFPEQQDFAIRTFGNLGGNGILGACFGSVVTMNSPGGLAHGKNNWEATLWHEFAHVVTLSVTKNKMPRWLSEGISVYEEMERNPTWGQRMTPVYRKMILEDGDLTPISQLSNAFLNPKSGTHIMFAYYQSYLVVEYIVDNYGIKALGNILKDLGDGVLINAAIEKHTVEMPQLEAKFANHAFELAKNLAPGVDWSQPEPGEVDPRSYIAVFAYLKKNPKNFWARKTYTQGLLAQKFWDKAIQSADELIKLYPDYVEGDSGYLLKAAAYRGMGKTEDEAAALRELAAKSSEAYVAYSRLMDLDLENENWDTLAMNADRAAALNPFMKHIHYCKGCALDAKGKPKEAIVSFEKLLSLRPVNPSEVRFRLAKLLKPEDTERSKRYLLDSLAESPRYREAHALLQKFEKQKAAKPENGSAPVADPFGGGGAAVPAPE